MANRKVATNLVKIFLTWLPLAFITTAMTGLIYISAQQVLRGSADSPQVQIAEDTAMALARGKDAASFASQTVDIRNSLAPFLIIYNNSNNVVASNARLNGQTPNLPPGVFQFVTKHGRERFTWQPQAKIRLAAVMVKYQGNGNSGYVLVARSLREVERREDWLLLSCLAVWAVTMVGSLGLITATKLVAAKL